MSCRSHSSHESFCFWCWICWYQTSVTNFCLLFNLSQQWRFLALSLLMRAPFINDVGCSLKKLTKGYIIVVQSLSYVWLFATPWTAECQASLSFSISQSLLKLMSIESVMPSIHFILCYPLLLLSIFPIIRVFSNELALLIRWPKYWSFNYNISSSNEYSGLISFRIDCFDIFAIQGILKSLLQHQSSNTIFIYTENSKESTNNY